MARKKIFWYKKNWNNIGRAKNRFYFFSYIFVYNICIFILNQLEYVNEWKMKVCDCVHNRSHMRKRGRRF